MVNNKLNLSGENLFFYSQSNLGGLSVDTVESIFIDGVKTYLDQPKTSLTISDEALIRFSTILYQEISCPEEVYKKHELGSLLHDLSESRSPLSEKNKLRLKKFVEL